MRSRVYTDRDADLRILRNRLCAVVGYGAQGSAQALNLRDSGIPVLIGLPPRSRSRRFAIDDRFDVATTSEASRRAKIVFLAVPDTKIPMVYYKQVAPVLCAGTTLLFAHGFAIHYRTIVPADDMNVVMVAPKGLGPMVRREFVS